MKTDLKEGEDSVDKNSQRAVFECSDKLCVSRFLTIPGLKKHELKTVHIGRKNTEPLLDTGDFYYYANS